MAQELGRLAGGIWGERSGSVETIRTELDALASQAGLDLALAHRLTPESLDMLVAPAGSTDPTRCWLLAEMFYLTGRLSQREIEVEAAQESFRRALTLYRRVDPHRLPDVEIPGVDERIADIEQRLADRT